MDSLSRTNIYADVYSFFIEIFKLFLIKFLVFYVEYLFLFDLNWIKNFFY